MSASHTHHHHRVLHTIQGSSTTQPHTPTLLLGKPPSPPPTPTPTRTNISPAERQAFVARHACGGCGAVGLWGCLKKFLVVGMQLVRTVRWGRGGTGQAQAPSDRIQDTGASWSARKEAADGRRLVSGNAELWVDGVSSIN